MSEKKYFSDNGLTHLKNVLKTKIKKTYVGEAEPTDESVIVWIKPSEAGTEIPTKTSDLTNDSGFITKTVNNLTNYTKTIDLSSVATSGSYNDLSDTPNIPTFSYDSSSQTLTITGE